MLPVGAQQPESFIGYFTTACVAIVLAIFSYILLPRMVRLCCCGGEGCGDMRPSRIAAQGPWPTSTPALAPTSLHLLGQGKLSPVLRELSGILPTSDTPIPLGYCGNEPLGELGRISIRHKSKEYFAHIAFAHICYYHTAPGSRLSSRMSEFSMAVSLQDFFRYYSMKDKTEYRVYNAELETKRDLIKKGEGLRRGRGRKEKMS